MNKENDNRGPDIPLEAARYSGVGAWFTGVLAGNWITILVGAGVWGGVKGMEIFDAKREQNKRGKIEDKNEDK